MCLFIFSPKGLVSFPRFSGTVAPGRPPSLLAQDRKCHVLVLDGVWYIEWSLITRKSRLCVTVTRHWFRACQNQEWGSIFCFSSHCIFFDLPLFTCLHVWVSMKATEGSQPWRAGVPQGWELPENRGMCGKHSQTPSQRCMASAALLSLICGQACSSETGISQGCWALVGISSGLELSQ